MVSDPRQMLDVVTHEIRESFHRAASACSSLARTACAWLRDAGGDLRLAGEGLIHISAASPAVKEDLRRDVTACVIDTGLAVAEDVALEVTVAVAALETAEKIVDEPDKIDVRTCVADFVESVAPDAIAAIHSAANVAADLEMAGLEWESRHRRSGTGAAPAP